MPVHFSHEQYEDIRKTYRKWWAGELDRPILPIKTYGHSGDIPPSKKPFLCCFNAWDFSIDPRDFIDAYDDSFQGCRWHAEGFPYISTSQFGPGALAAFLGCTPVGAPSTVWFHPSRPDMPIEELHFEFDENNPCYRRIVNFYEAAMEKWHGSVVVNMMDLGGVMDVLASFRGTQNLLIDLIEDEDEVLRCVREIQEMWFLYYNKLNEIMAPEAEGYSDWYHMYQETPGYILQSDFSYMISPDMFGTFVAPELASSAARMTNAVYHMDGIGQIPHLDQILAIEGIKGIQWVPGDGDPVTWNWDHIHERILASGKKLIHRARKPDGRPIDVAAKNPGQLYFEECHYHVNDMESARRYAGLYGVEVE